MKPKKNAQYVLEIITGGLKVYSYTLLLLPSILICS